MNNLINLKKIEDDGFCLIKSFLKKDEIDRVVEIISSEKSPKGDKKTIYAKDLKGQVIKLLKLDLKKFVQSRFLIDLGKKKELGEIANNLFKKKSSLNMIDGYYSKISNKDVLPWHCDQAYSGKENVEKFYNPDDFNFKFFFYLSSVGPNNGCTSYIPGSQKITYLIRKGIFEKKIKYQPYWTLKQLRNFILVNDNYSFMRDNIENISLIDSFLDKTQFINNDSDTREYDFYAEPGDVLIFNEGGVHKGSKVTLNDRMVLRYLYSRKK